MKKNVFIVIALILGCSLFFAPQVIRVNADSGFDADWDSGGSDWDSDWGSDWDDDYDYGSSSGGDASLEAILIFVAFVAIIIILSIVFPSKKSGTSSSSKYMETEFIPEIDFPNFDEAKFKNKAFEIYKDVQLGWMAFDYELIRKNTTDELYNMYRSQLETLKIKNQQNIMGNITYRNCYIKSITEDKNGIKTAVVILEVSCYDYLINTTTNQVVRGNKNIPLYYTYSLTFVQRKAEQLGITVCPNCGAKVDANASGKCEYCNSVIINDEYDWVLSKKQMLKQRR